MRYAGAVKAGNLLKLNVKIIKKTNMPEQFYRLFLGKKENGEMCFHTQTAQKFLKKYIDDFVKYFPVINFLIFGGHGSGKTSILCFLIKECYKRYEYGFYTTAHALVDSIAKDDKFNSEYSVWEWASRCSCLVIDDLGDEYLCKSTGKFDSLIGERFNRGLITHVSTNYSLKELLVKYKNKSTRNFLEHRTSQIFLEDRNFYSEEKTKEIMSDFSEYGKK